MRLSALFEEFCQFQLVEKEAARSTINTYRWCFKDFEQFVGEEIKGTVLTTHFTTDLCRTYQYDLVTRRKLGASTVRLRLATLGSFGKWATQRRKLAENPVGSLTRPRRHSRMPHVPRWNVVEALLRDGDPRERALIALMAYGGLRRSEVVALDVGDFAPDLGLRRVHGKGGHEAVVHLPEIAREILSDYLGKERPDSKVSAPMFIVRYRSRGGGWSERRMADHRVWKIVRALGGRAGIPDLHPHAFRHGCGVEMLRRTGGNLRMVQEHLRHADIQTRRRPESCGKREMAHSSGW
jgi:site-specific recombinase XerD